MKKQFAVIGLGNFGFYLASGLFQKGHDVLGIDINPRQVQEIRDLVSRAVIADATDLQALKELELEKMDAVVVSIGSVLNSSILATLNVKDMGVQRVVAKAVSNAHGRVLQKIGADEIYFPEKDIALTAAQRLDNPNVLDYLPLMEGYSIAQLAPPKEFIGKTLMELDLINRHGIEPSPRLAAGNLHRKDENRFPVRSLTPPQAARNALAIAVQVVAVKELVPENVVMIPTGKYLVKDSDLLVLLGPDKALAGLKK